VYSPAETHTDKHNDALLALTTATPTPTTLTTAQTTTTNTTTNTATTIINTPPTTTQTTKTATAATIDEVDVTNLSINTPQAISRCITLFLFSSSPCAMHAFHTLPLY
jgi:hypothetical protein